MQHKLIESNGPVLQWSCFYRAAVFDNTYFLNTFSLLASVTLFFLLSAPLCTASQSSCLLSSDVPPGFRTISEPFHLFPQLQLSEDLLPF